jgi:small subunit ribosomal protein S13e
MYGGGKGMADSALPYKRTPPSWLRISAKDVEGDGTSELHLVMR